MTNLLTIAEVASYLKTTNTTIYRWLKEKKLTAVKIGKEWRIEEALLNSIIHQEKNNDEKHEPFWNSLGKKEHIMLITDKKSEVPQFEVSLFKEGLSEGARIMKGCWWQKEDEIVEQYTTLGLDAAYLIKNKIMTIINLSKLFKKEGIDGPVRAWYSSVENAVSSGISRLWASGSPSMNCCGNDSNLVLAFEKKLNETIKNIPVIGFCVYALEDENNRDNFESMLKIMGHHSGIAFYCNGQYTLLRS